MEQAQLVEIAKGITKFALAFGSLPKDMFLAALSGQAMLSQDQWVSSDQARRLIEAFPKTCLNNPPRERIWREVQLDPHTIDFETLREAIESDLKNPKRASRYLIPPLVRAQTKICGFLAMKAAKIEAIVSSFGSREQQIQQIVKLLEPFLTVSSANKRSENLSLKILSHQVIVGQVVPIQAYYTKSDKTYNVTRKTDFDVQPAFRAELNDSQVVTLAPGPVRIRGTYNGESAVVDLFVTPSAASQMESGDEFVVPKPAARPPTERLETTPVTEQESDDGLRTIALTEASQREFQKLTSHRLDAAPANLDPEDSSDDFFSAQTMVGNVDEVFSPDEDAIATIQVSASDDPRQKVRPAPEGFAIQTTQVMPPEEASGESDSKHASQSGATARFVPAPLVVAVVAVLEPHSPVDQILIDGQKAWTYYSTSVSHVLLQPGLRMIDMNFSGRGKLVAHSRFAIEWQLPEVSHDDLGELLGDAPPLCLELFVKIANSGHVTVRLRCLTMSDYIALTHGPNRSSVALKLRSEDCYFADFELQQQRLILQANGRCGEHTLNLSFQHERY